MNYNDKLNLILNKIINNINNSNVFIASPSKNNPNYFYHWIRDSALVMRVILKEYEKNNSKKFLDIILKYINLEYKLQKLNTLSGIGEPKFNSNISSFNESWGRPQNDGPALRGIIMLKIIKLFRNDYDVLIKNIIEIILKKDLEYICNTLHDSCFDLWEENKGYHYYTRVVQCKFLKESYNYFNDEYLKEKYLECKELLNHHYDNKSVISSFDLNGKELRRDDSSIFMAVSHIDFDNDIISFDKYQLINNNISKLLEFFNNKYGNTYNFIGRYINDKYFNGHSWIICTLGMIQFNNFNQQNKLQSKDLIEKIFDIDEYLDLSEQYDPKNNIQYSAINLTWNYSELYFSLINLHSL